MSLGVLFAVTATDAARLLAARGDDDALTEIVEDLEERWEEGFVGETDKGWDPVHRSLGDGTLDPGGPEPPLDRAVLGGDLLTEGEDLFVAFTPADQVPAVSAALEAVTEERLRDGHRRIAAADYEGALGDEDWLYTLENFGAVRDLWRAAAAAGRGVVFTV